ncbi:hypothetical protein LAZ67_16001173 [Cordylochernes scorpioides]|uniref:ATP-dependent DNA helicase n=1 Tax=Cordylochernes scorpioides TaxID=51811 RepID=A0ABY6LFC3_9ARAC|nr:hypothetical protein LAZ67_16001173 [Cordylochernes scorpioides]
MPRKRSAIGVRTPAARRMAARAARGQSSRTLENPQQSQARLQSDQLRHRVQRASETPQQSQTRQEADRLRHFRQRASTWADMLNAAFHYNPALNYEQFTFLQIGHMDKQCLHCTAFKYNGERSGMCCSAGKVRIPDLPEPPEALRTLFDGSSPHSAEFMQRVRHYNNAFQMTSFGCGSRVVLPGYMPTFTVQGQVYHRIGSVLPPLNSDSRQLQPAFLQVFFIGDSSAEVATRHRNLPITKPPIVSIFKICYIDIILKTVESERLHYISAHQAQLLRETTYDLSRLLQFVASNEPKLANVPEQKEAYERILSKIDSNAGGLTAHSTFKLPLDLTRDEVPICNLNADSAMGEVLRQCKFIVWDDCTMAHRHALEAVDITLKDCRQDQRPMGSVVLLLAGDFRQILPIIPREATILTVCFQNEEVFISRIPLIHDDKHSPLHFKRLQFPIQVSFAMSINKAQGQSLKIAGIDLEQPCFWHGQFVACWLEAVVVVERWVVRTHRRQDPEAKTREEIDRGGKIEGPRTTPRTTGVEATSVRTELLSTRLAALSKISPLGEIMKS